jgi:hypothetical protein
MIVLLILLAMRSSKIRSKSRRISEKNEQKERRRSLTTYELFI